ncbi:MAG: cobalamin-binding protein [Betaproteobacteria bacterium]|nr:cobalamin-binding protein [Betaproteobacteria bacterium]
MILRAAWVCLLAAPLLGAGAGARAVAAAGIVVVDDAGQPVMLSGPARRVVSLAPDLTELLFTAGAGERLVGVAERSDYPAAAKDIQRVGDAHGFDFERIVALKPDLILGWAGGNAPQHLARLRSLGLRIFLSDIREPEGIASTLERLGTLSGTRPKAQEAARTLRERLRSLREAYAGKRPLRVFYQVWGQPLYTLGGTHMVSVALGLCGATNVFADLPVLATVVETEGVLQRDPEVIIAAAEGARRPDWLDAWKRWPTLKAVRHQALVVVNADLMNRHSARFVEGIAELCAQLDRERAKAVE